MNYNKVINIVFWIVLILVLGYFVFAFLAPAKSQESNCQTVEQFLQVAAEGGAERYREFSGVEAKSFYTAIVQNTQNVPPDLNKLIVFSPYGEVGVVMVHFFNEAGCNMNMRMSVEVSYFGEVVRAWEARRNNAI